MSDIPPLKDGDQIIITKLGDKPDGFSLEFHPKGGGIIGYGPIALPLEEVFRRIKSAKTPS